MAKQWRIAGLSLLAVVGVLAVSASTVQAKWLILENSKSVTKLELKGTAEGGYFLSENGNKLHCNGSTSTGTATLSEEGKTLSGTLTATFTGCTEEQFKTTCTVHSAGQANGTIVATGSGVADMPKNAKGEPLPGIETFFIAKSSNFTTLEYLGEECPLNETKEVIAGTLKNIVLEPLTDLKLHKFHAVGENLKLGSSSVELHMLDPETKAPLKLVSGSTETVSGSTFALHLCALPNAPIAKCGP